MSFEKFGINRAILDALKQEGFKNPTPIQSRAVPALLAGSDLLGGAETGTGKTAAFAIPLLDKLSCRKKSGKNPRALILVPTRELALQVYENIRSYGRFLKLTCTEIYGGVSIQPQIKKLDKGTDIVIATPGRLLDLINQDAVRLKNIEMLVLDEADRMLDMGFIADIKKIIGYIPKERQTMMFSATFPSEIKKLADRMLVNPEIIELSPENKAAVTVSQSVYPVINEKKLKLLCRLIKDKGWYQVLVFTKTKRRAQSLSLQLVKKGVSADSIHGDKSQGARTRALNNFKKGKIQALVATDIAARGIDINQLDCVVNFQMPQQAEDYIHRIGRTGRAGQAGTAVSLVSAEDIEQFRSIEKHLNRKIETVFLDDFVTESLKKEVSKNTLLNDNSRKSSGNRSKAAAGGKNRHFPDPGNSGRADKSVRRGKNRGLSSSSGYSDLRKSGKAAPGRKVSSGPSYRKTDSSDSVSSYYREDLSSSSEKTVKTYRGRASSASGRRKRGSRKSA